MTSDVLHWAISGDLTAFGAIVEWTDEQFAVAARGRDFPVPAQAVAAVLRAFQEDRVSAPQAQRWAEFVRWTSLGGRSIDLEIDYEPTDEDAISLAVARLDELGDLIDGEFPPGEIDQLPASLRS